VNVVTGLAAAALGVLLVAALGEDGLVFAVLATAAVQFALSRALLTRTIRRFEGEAAPEPVRSSARTMLGAGLPVAAGPLAGSGAVFLVPILVLQVLDTADVGQYRAAAAISIGYLTFFLAALTQDYYPRLSRTADPFELGVLVERRMRLLLGLGVPVVVGLLAAGPWLIELLYTSEFGPAYDVLQWQLVGDLLRLPAWVFVFVLLTRGRAGGYVGAEAIGGVAVLGASLLGLVTLGLEGAGVGYAVSQLVYYGGAWWLVRGHIAATPGRLQAVVLATALLAAGVLVSPLDPASRSIIFGASAAGLAALAWPRMYRLHRRGEL
jgi:PST family polysaccharide transporter